MDNRSDIWRGVDTIKPRFIALSDKVWGMPEVCYTEARSSAEHLAELRHQVLAPPGKAPGARRVCASDTPVLCLFEFGTEERSDDGRWRLPF